MPRRVKGSDGKSTTQRALQATTPPPEQNRKSIFDGEGVAKLLLAYYTGGTTLAGAATALGQQSRANAANRATQAGIEGQFGGAVQGGGAPPGGGQQLQTRTAGLTGVPGDKIPAMSGQAPGGYTADVSTSSRPLTYDEIDEGLKAQGDYGSRGDAGFAESRYGGGPGLGVDPLSMSGGMVVGPGITPQPQPQTRGPAGAPPAEASAATGGGQPASQPAAPPPIEAAEHEKVVEGYEKQIADLQANSLLTPDQRLQVVEQREAEAAAVVAKAQEQEKFANGRVALNDMDSAVKYSALADSPLKKARAVQVMGLYGSRHLTKKGESPLVGFEKGVALAHKLFPKESVQDGLIATFTKRMRADKLRLDVKEKSEGMEDRLGRAKSLAGQSKLKESMDKQAFDSRLKWEKARGDKSERDMAKRANRGKGGKGGVGSGGRGRKPQYDMSRLTSKVNSENTKAASDLKTANTAQTKRSAALGESESKLAAHQKKVEALEAKFAKAETAGRNRAAEDFKDEIAKLSKKTAGLTAAVASDGKAFSDSNEKANLAQRRAAWSRDAVTTLTQVDRDFTSRRVGTDAMDKFVEWFERGFSETSEPGDAQ